mmetsp:Transcript_142887/g.319555  ORF Transcript_142887/g.319555 Transcript_142887/m.319555 type:complete len:133 (+) Transcript_142887:108-506(+)
MLETTFFAIRLARLLQACPQLQLKTATLKGFELRRLLPILPSGQALETLSLYSLRDVEAAVVRDLIQIVCDLRHLRCFELAFGDKNLVDVISDGLGRVAKWCCEDTQPDFQSVWDADIARTLWRVTKRLPGQ